MDLPRLRRGLVLGALAASAVLVAAAPVASAVPTPAAAPAAPAAATASLDDEKALAERFAPVVAW